MQQSIIIEHGKRKTPLYHEMDAYERAIAGFRQKAESYYRRQYRAAKKKGETPEERQTRLKNKREEFRHLKNEALLAKTMASVQVELEQFRQNKMTVDQMNAEKHHPTETLESMLRGAGRPKPSTKHTAHHIVPGKGKTQNAANARIELHLHNIRINDPDNGVWMIRLKEDKGHWSMPKANSHLEIHTHNYERWVYQRLLGAFDEPEARGILRQIGKLVTDGNQPKKVTMPPDNEWNGYE